MDDQGSSSAGEWLRSVVARYEGPLVRYAARITRDPERARDVVQDTFLRLCREDRAQLDGHLAQWLFQVCRHRALDVQRKEHRMRATLTEKLDARADGSPDRVEAAEHGETHQVTE